jgi:hypothetical protein
MFIYSRIYRVLLFHAPTGCERRNDVRKTGKLRRCELDIVEELREK